MNDQESFGADDLARIRIVISEHRALDGPLLPILHGIQEALGFIPDAAVPEIARELNLSRAEVAGVLSYYKHFRSEPPGRCVVSVCRAESCRTLGGEALLAQARRHGGCSERQPTSADGRFTVEPVYCLGLCALSPALAINGHPHARMTAERLAALLEAQTP